MDVRATGGVVTKTSSGNCGCGCGGTCGCESRCCDLDCIVRPNFFCGQLLTDADLGATVEWARTRFSLSRYRHGWGVVCGLDVTCASPRNRGNCCDDTKGPTVWLNPGYAIDCCGNDLVVCEPMPIDLAEFCSALDDPCAEPVTPKRPPTRPGLAGGIRDPKGVAGPNDPGRIIAAAMGRPKPRDDERMHRIVPGAPELDLKDDRANCYDIPSGEVIAVDLMLRYHEDLSDGQRPMFRGQCSDLTACEYTRVLERPCVHGEIGDLDRVCDVDDFEDWQKDFLERWTEARRAIKEVAFVGPEALLRYIRRHPPYKFCFLEDIVCCLIGQPGKPETLLGGVVFLLYLDWLLHELRCPCPSCRPDRGVPIARVLLRRADQAAGRRCRVLFIETGTPYRRPLERDECRPRRRGRIDLVPYYWEPFSVAADRLAASGIELIEMPGQDQNELLGVFDRRPVMLDSEPGQTLRAYLVDMMGCRRIVAFASDKL